MENVVRHFNLAAQTAYKIRLSPFLKGNVTSTSKSNKKVNIIRRESNVFKQCLFSVSDIHVMMMTIKTSCENQFFHRTFPSLCTTWLLLRSVSLFFRSKLHLNNK